MRGGAPNEDILKAWCESRAHFIDPPSRRGDRAATPPAAAAGPSSASRPRTPSPEEISQRSVDALLAEYYKMVKGSQGSSGAADAPGALQRVLLAVLCPPLPFIGLGALFQLAAASLGAAAHTLVYLSWAAVPALIAAVATLLQLGRQHEAAAAAAAGLVVLLAANAAVRGAAEARRAKQEGAVTAASVRDVLPGQGAGGVKRQLAAAVGAAAKHRATQQQAAAQQAAANGPAAAAAAAAAGGEAEAYAQLLPALEGLQRLVGGGAGEAGGAGPKDALAAGVQRLCTTVGYPLAPGALDTADAAARTIEALKKHLGAP